MNDIDAKREEIQHWPAEYLAEQFRVYQTLQARNWRDEVMLELIAQEMDRREMEEANGC